MAIACNEIPQTISYLKNQFVSCKPMKAEDMQLLLDLLVAVANCSEGGISFVEHNDTQNKQGGSELLNEFFHITQEQYDSLANIVDNDLINQILDSLADIEEQLENLNITYNGASPSTISVGGIPEGYILTGKTYEEIIQQMLVVYQNPTFNSFFISGQNTFIEVGTLLEGDKLFNWSTNNNINIQVNSISIRDINTNTLIETGLTNDGSEIIDIGTIVNSNPINQSWRAEGINTNTQQFNSNNFTVQSGYPVFWYKSNSPITPIIMQNAISNGLAIKIVIPSNGNFTIPFAANGEYIAFAYPETSTTKTIWYVTALNSGSIPGGVFGSANILEVDSPDNLWSNINYKIHVSPGLVTELNPMELRNN